MGLVLQLVETCADGGRRSIDLMELGRPGSLHDIADLGLTLPEAKQLLACVQQAVVAVQARDHATLRPDCASCGERFRLKDWRSRRVATLFGEVVVRPPRFRCPGCGRGERGTNWPAHCRSTPELDQLQAHLSALMTYRVAAGVLAHLLPVAAGTSLGTLRRHTLKLGERLRNAATVEPNAVDAAAVPAIALSLDATFIRSCHEGERHLEVRVGNAETPGGGRQLFGAVANAGTDIVATEGTANFLVNRRMAKSQQMRWSRRGADLLLQVRCAVYNGALGTGFGQRFHAANDPHPPAASAA